MKRLALCLVIVSTFLSSQSQAPSGAEILERIDRNMLSSTKVIVSRMVIHGRRESRTIEAKSWQRGTSDTFTEYLAPAREKGTKMLKLKDLLWLYSPSTDRTILLSGHMLRQSVMGSDLSYEDMMEDPRLANLYSANVASEERVGDRTCWVVDLAAKKEDVAYSKRKIWVDKARFVILREDLFAKSGTLLKTVEVREVMNVEGRWMGKNVLFKDVMKNGGGTEFIVQSIDLDPPIPGYLFSKAALKR